MKRLTVMLVLLSVLGCGGAPAGPRPIAVGVDPCDYCGMLIDDTNRAAQFVGADGHVHVFDEPGCMLAWLRNHAERVGDAFVADEAGTGWVLVQEATLVRGATRTAMGFGITAFRTAERAAQAAQRAGATLHSWSELLGEQTTHAKAP